MYNSGSSVSVPGRPSWRSWLLFSKMMRKREAIAFCSVSHFESIQVEELSLRKMFLRVGLLKITFLGIRIMCQRMFSKGSQTLHSFFSSQDCGQTFFFNSDWVSESLRFAKRGWFGISGWKDLTHPAFSAHTFSPSEDHSGQILSCLASTWCRWHFQRFNISINLPKSKVFAI